MLADYPAETLHETIKDFHDTKKRFQALKDAVEKDCCHRAASVKKKLRLHCSMKIWLEYLENFWKMGKFHFG